MLALIELWVVFLVIVVAIAVYRKMVAGKEDDVVHLSGGDKVVANQAQVANQLGKIDLAGKVLTTAFILYSVAVVARVIYLGWVDSAQFH